jgi:hypothetical protein
MILNKGSVSLILLNDSMLKPPISGRLMLAKVEMAVCLVFLKYWHNH